MTDDTTDTAGEESGQPLASADDFRIQRDEDGELLPVREAVPGMEKDIKCIPLPDGAGNRLIPETARPADMDDEHVVEVLDEWIVEPDFNIDRSRDPEEVLEEFKSFPLSPLLQAVFNASGYEVFNGMLSETIEGDDALADVFQEIVEDGMDSGEGGEGNGESTSTSSRGSGSAEQSTSSPATGTESTTTSQS